MFWVLRLLFWFPFLERNCTWSDILSSPSLPSLPCCPFCTFCLIWACGDVLSHAFHATRSKWVWEPDYTDPSLCCYAALHWDHSPIWPDSITARDFSRFMVITGTNILYICICISRLIDVDWCYLLQTISYKLIECSYIRKAQVPPGPTMQMSMVH